MTEPTLALIAFLFPLAYSPGPGNLFFAANGARFGFRATVPANIGYHLATWIVTCALGLGFSALAAQAGMLLGLLKWLGSAYVLLLAWRFLRAGALQGAAAARPAGFADGALLLVLNPKAYVIIALMFTQFLGGGDAAATGPVVWIATVFTLNNMLAFVLWTLLGDRLAAGFRQDIAARRLNTVLGAMLAAVAFWMLAA
ncbi:Threonine/homoserine/homoserine lactone efflux protein [Paracoccus halophilus]|uniref:Lysine transporter LysE n=1 Tax=Paracoccus halophilus TaxID=376733 RepID=A0A099F1L6_9RHOB|nr:LysE family translocator [Paracoccus halophilus]KGJ04570.1 lysine transporter LysE [Paracoccus halophilus]SFA50176.1 Threonine/homoserine/homoserine lactone efflux protein [Paracoccus halophilus]